MSGAPVEVGAPPSRGNPHPTDHAAALGGRLPLLRAEALTDAQRAVYDLVVATRVPEARRNGFDAILPDGRLIGPFNTFLYVPEIARGLGGWVEAQGRHAGLADDVRQVTILAVGAAWGAAYELYAHTAAARRAGLSDAAIDAITAGREPDGVSPDARVAYRVADALVRRHAVPDALYAEAVAAFGAAGVVALVHLVGQYLTISALLTCFRIPAPADA